MATSIDASSSPGTAALFSLWCAAQLQPLGSAGRAARGSGASAGFDAAAYAAANLLEVQFSDGSVYYTDPQEFAALHPDRSAARGAAAAADRVQLSFDLRSGMAATRSGGEAAAVVVDQYRLARLTEPTTLDALYDFGQLFTDTLGGWFGTPKAPAAGALAGKLCRAFENAVLDARLGTANGLLLFWDAASAAWQPLPADGAGLPLHDQALLLLHGTASSTQGSFAGLWAPEPSFGPAPDRAAVGADFARLAQTRLLLAFEHRSLTASPLLNVVELLRRLQQVLPAGCELNLLSHSRGGLVGELLCPVLGGELAAPDRQAFATTLQGAYPHDHPDQARVPEYAALLAALGGRWRAGSFVRVACPARGTLLADRRTDLFLSLLLRSVGLAVGGIGNPWFEALQGLARALVASRSQASALPGLEAMIPGAPLSRALNVPQPGLVLPGRLRVVAGDSMALGWGGVLSLLGDVFYGLHDHDFVVHTHSMFGGLPRSDARSLRIEDKSVTHFGYFKPGSLTRTPILAALAGVDSGFNRLEDDEAITRGMWQMFSSSPLSRRPLQEWLLPLQAADCERKPILVVLPGIMGSELARHPSDTQDLSLRTPVWLSLQSLLGGDLTQLDLAVGDALVPSGVMAVAYERLLKQAAASFHVVAMPYDWRKPVQQAGDALYMLLADTLLPAARRLGKPVHILAHSMGGLVARSALFWNADTGITPAQRNAITPEQRKTLWADIGRCDGRLLMLGTPNQGSYAPVQLLLQQHGTASLVAMAASQVSAAQLAQWGAAFPGLLAMLPAEPDPLFGDLFQAGTWAEMRRADAVTALPDAGVLAQARAVRSWLNSSFDALKSDPRVLYVAGQGATPKGLKRMPGAAAGQVLRLGISQQGDGTVPWDSVLLPERTWYVASSHGDLPDRTDAFAGYFELLTQGHSNQLSHQPPASRAADDATAVLVLPALPSLPADPTAFLLGVTRRPAQARWLPPIEVRVVHCSLDYARFPLMVGHYQNDSLLGAVKRVNQKLAGQLQRMVELKLFAGAARTTAYLRPPTPDGKAPSYPGAVVLGLGAVGELTPATLAQTVTRGVLRYAFEHAYQDAWVPAGGPLTLRLSTLLIGTHVQAVGVRDSLAGVLYGVWRASQLLASDTALARSVRVAALEVVEIDESTALDAAYQLKRLLARSEWAPRFCWSPATLETRDGGLSGFRPSDPDSIWQRLVVGQDDNGGLKFELIAERARVESTRVHAAVASLTDYIARVSDAGASGGGGASDSEEQASLGRVLYQLLLPQPLKARLANFEQTVLVLDDAAAALPWELLTPPVGDSLGQDAAMPLAVQAGMVRQRVTSEFRSLPGRFGGLDALVVGAPLTDGWTSARGETLAFSPLPGAEDEARQVTRLLSSQQWQVKALQPGSGFERVRTALYERSWRVLHLCGHGVVDQWVGEQGQGALRRPMLRTGMVLSHQQVLSAGDVEQMDPAPEFVFINCCYSGRDGRADGVHRNDPMLASSLALQFIRMGSKAVVAAGWQVDDADGLAFASALYAALLDGQPFGDAVREARRVVYTQGNGSTPRSNTWGAYQCYGDPQWRLVAQLPGSEQGSSVMAEAHRCMSKYELASRILQMVAIAGDKPADVLLAQLDELIARLRDDPDRREWLRSSRVRAALGEAYRELGAHLKALTWFQRAAKTAYSRLELRHLELGVNSLSRLQPEDMTADQHAGHRAARSLLAVLDRLDQLDASGLKVEPESRDEYAASAASERLCLQGSDCMRQAAAITDSPVGRGGLLYLAARAYRRGYISKVKRGDLAERRAFALSSALVAAGLTVLVGSRPHAQRMLRRLQRPLRPAMDWEGATQLLLDEMERVALGATFWHYTNTLDLLLARQVLAIALNEAAPADDLQRVGNLLERALVRWPAPVEVESMLHRMRLIADVLRTAAPPAKSQAARRLALLAAVDHAVARLQTYADGSLAAC